MANDVAKFFGGHQLPDRAKLSEAMKGLNAAKASMGGKALLRFTKVGTWVFGPDSEPLKPGTKLIANPASLSSGFIAWWLAQVEGEVMQPLSMGPVDATKLAEVNSGGINPATKKVSGQGWQPQLSIDLITQADVPLSMTYKVTSRGGMTTLMDLAGTIAYDMSMDEKRCYPVIELSGSSYQHSDKEIGEVQIPILSVVGWLDADGKEVKDLSSLL